MKIRGATVPFTIGTVLYLRTDCSTINDLRHWTYARRESISYYLFFCPHHRYNIYTSGASRTPYVKTFPILVWHECKTLRLTPPPHVFHSWKRTIWPYRFIFNALLNQLPIQLSRFWFRYHSAPKLPLPRPGMFLLIKRFYFFVYSHITKRK